MLSLNILHTSCLSGILKQNCCQFILDSFWLGGWIIWKHKFSWWHLIWLCLKEGKRDNCFKTFQLFKEKTNTNLRRRGLVSMFEYLTTWDRSLRTLPDIGRNFIRETSECKVNLKVYSLWQEIVFVYATECLSANWGQKWRHCLWENATIGCQSMSLFSSFYSGASLSWPPYRKDCILKGVVGEGGYNLLFYMVYYFELLV